MSRKSQEHDPLAAQLGARITAFRKENGLRQWELAEQAGIPRPQMCRYEAGSQFPSLRNLMALARFTGIPVDELLFGKQDGARAIHDHQLRERFLTIDAMPAKERAIARNLLDMFIVSRTKGGT